MNALKSKFRGCLIGALVGDALGSYYEASSFSSIPLEDVEKTNSVEHIIKSRRKFTLDDSSPIQYTDDTAMTKAMCRSLVECRGFDQKDMAKKFTEEYFLESWRGYGGGVVKVFEALNKSMPEDVTLPAQKQFDGRGSYGNGAAMRVAPVALFSKDLETLKQIARDQAMITHTNTEAVHGAILQAAAIQKALDIDPPNINAVEFINYLMQITEELEQHADEEGDEERGTTSIGRSYITQFEKIKELHSKGPELLLEEATSSLGNGISAYEAVSAAIFSFVSNTDRSLEESVNRAIALGGDTDTIACMCGGIAGAYWGIQAVPEHWLASVESVDKMQEFADQLFEMRGSGDDTHEKE